MCALYAASQQLIFYFDSRPVFLLLFSLSRAAGAGADADARDVNKKENRVFFQVSLTFFY